MSITLHNFTDVKLGRKNFGLSHGMWKKNSNAVPPEIVEAYQSVSFGSESDGFATGTEGHVVYTSNQGDFHIGWNNPFVGSNGFGVAVPPGFRGIHTDISGNNANVEVFIFKG